MTQYLLSVHHDYYNETPGRTSDEQIFADVATFNDSIKEALVFGGGLEAPHTATVVELRDGQLVMTDGPYAESKEAVGGFWVIEASDLDAALEMAGRATAACRAPIEVRPFEAV